MSKISEKKNKKRNALLNSAYQLFLAKGFENTSVLEIVMGAGVAKGTFYLYFDSKESVRDELVVIKSSELLRAATEQLNSNLSTTADLNVQPIPATPSGHILFVVNYIIELLQADIPLLRFISNNLSWGIFLRSTDFEDNNEDILNFREYISQAANRSGYEIDDMMPLLFTILEMANSTCYSAIVYNEPMPIDKYKPFLYRYISTLVEQATHKRDNNQH